MKTHTHMYTHSLTHTHTHTHTHTYTHTHTRKYAQTHTCIHEIRLRVRVFMYPRASNIEILVIMCDVKIAFIIARKEIM